MKTFQASDVNRAIAEVLRLPDERVVDGARLSDLVTDSFVLVELVVELQELFDVQFFREDLTDALEVGDVARLVSDRRQA
jgi:acyl carrier protein